MPHGSDASRLPFANALCMLLLIGSSCRWNSFYFNYNNILMLLLLSMLLMLLMLLAVVDVVGCCCCCCSYFGSSLVFISDVDCMINERRYAFTSRVQRLCHQLPCNLSACAAAWAHCISRCCYLHKTAHKKQ